MEANIWDNKGICPTQPLAHSVHYKYGTVHYMYNLPLMLTEPTHRYASENIGIYNDTLQLKSDWDIRTVQDGNPKSEGGILRWWWS